MELNEYQKKALETAVYPSEYKVIYPALGMNGEAGEVADKVKKTIRDTIVLKNAITGEIILPDEKRKELAKEVGYVLWYVATMANDIGYSLEEIGKMNIEKLQSRKERGVLGGNGDNR